MKISHVQRMLRKGKGGNFRPLKTGEIIEDADIICADTYYDYPTSAIGQPCNDKDRIIRLEFNEKL